MTYDLEKLDTPLWMGTWVYLPGEGFVPLCGTPMLQDEHEPAPLEGPIEYGREDFERWVYSLRADV